jgi:hypothetical protein
MSWPLSGVENGSDSSARIGTLAMRIRRAWRRIRSGSKSVGVDMALLSIPLA